MRFSYNPVAIFLLSITVAWLFLCQSPLYPIYFKMLSSGRWFLMAALGIVFLAVGRRKGIRIRLSRLIIFPVVFGSYFYTTKLWSIYPELTAYRSISVLLLGFVVISIIRYVGDSIPRRDSVLMAVIFPIPLVFWLLSYKYGFDVTYIEMGILRTPGPMLNPNSIGVLGALMAPIAFYLLRSDSGMGKYWIFSILTFIFMILISGSRGSMVAIIAACFVIFITSTKRIRNTYFFILWGMIVIVSFLFLESVANFLEVYFRLDSIETGSGRLEAWESAIEILIKRPWTGYGFGVEDRIFDYFGFRFHEHAGAAVHNSYLGLSVQVGLPAALIFYISLFMITIKSYKLCLRYGNREDVILVACVISGLVLGVWESWLYAAGSASALPFWIIFGIMVRSFGTKKVILANKIIKQPRVSGREHNWH